MVKCTLSRSTVCPRKESKAPPVLEHPLFLSTQATFSQIPKLGYFFFPQIRKFPAFLPTTVVSTSLTYVRCSTVVLTCKAMFYDGETVSACTRMRQGGDHSLPDRSETTCGLARPPFVHLVWEPFCRMDHLFSPLFTAPDHLRFWVDGHPGLDHFRCYAIVWKFRR